MKLTVRFSVATSLQGGGAHGAFTWGVLDKLLEDGRVNIDSISACSAGSLTAAVFAQGRLKGGNDGARQALHDFWKKVSQVEHLSTEHQKPVYDTFMRYFQYNAFDNITKMLSPYQFNRLNINPLRNIVESLVDFDELKYNKMTGLFITTTNVRTGKVRVFNTEEISLDVVMASACLPYLFQAVKVDDDYYWDGGYSGNPAIFPLFYHSTTRDVIVVHINPMIRSKLPTKSNEIANRINEITFNCSLLHEFRAIDFVKKILKEGWIKDEHRHNLHDMYIHSIRADEALHAFNVTSKFDTHWYFLTYLRDLGRIEAKNWLAENFNNIGKKSTVDLHRDFLDNHEGEIA